MRDCKFLFVRVTAALFMSCISAFSVSAQSVPSQEQTMRVNNLVVCRMYDSAEQIFDAIGARPDSIRGPQPFDELQDEYIFYFGKDQITWAEKCVSDVLLETDRFAFNGKIRVGDSVGKLSELGGTISRKDDVISWKSSDDPKATEGIEVTFYVSDDKISGIWIWVNMF